MSGRSRWCLFWVVYSAVFLIGRCSHADEPPVLSTPQEERDKLQVAAIELALDVIDLVFEHHIDSPTRPRMMRRMADELHRQLNRAISPSLEQLADRCTDRDGSRGFLARLATDLAPAIDEFNSNENNAPNTAPTLQSMRQRRREKIAEKARVTFEGLLEVALSDLAPGRLDVMETKELKVQEQFQANRYVGIGVALGSDDDGYAYFARLFAGAPAEKGGIVEGDAIESIDGQSMKGLKLTEIVDHLRGPQGTTLTIAVRSKGTAESRTLTITRDVVPRSTVNGWGYVEGRSVFRLSPASAIAYIRIGEIGGSTVDELRRVEQQLTDEGAKGVVLDLRDCHGGPHHFAALLADALLDGGTIGRVRTKTRVQEFVADRECLFRGWPLAVLVNQQTSNTADWVAAALQDNRRAVIVGEATGSQRYAYTSFPFRDGKQSLRLATGILERPSGEPIGQSLVDEPNDDRQLGPSREWRVVPDHVVASAPKYVGVAGNLTIRVLSDSPDEPGVKKARELLEALLDAPLKLVPSQRP